MILGDIEFRISPGLGDGMLEENHVWQRRFYDFVVWSESKRVEKLRYMHRNPVKRGLVLEPDQWGWSSFRYSAYNELGPVLVNELRRAELTIRLRWPKESAAIRKPANGDYRYPPLQRTQGWGNLCLGGADKNRAPFLTSVKLTSIFLNFAIPLLATAIAAAGPAPDVHSIAQAVDERYNHLHSLQAEFTEIYRGAGMERTESGTLWLKKPGKMRWEYRSPREKLFLSDGKDAWFYVPGERQVRRTAVKKLDDLRSPLAFLLGKTKLEKELQGLSLAPDVAPLVAGDAVLRGVPKTLADRVSQVLLEITPEHWIGRILIEEVDGSVTEYRFNSQREDVAVPDSRFQFTPPAGVEVIDGDWGQ